MGSCDVLSFEKKGRKTPWFYNFFPICFPESLAPSRKRGDGKISVEDRCNFEKIWVNKKSMSWAWFRKPYLHQNPPVQANSVYQQHYTTALVVTGYYMSRKKSCFGIGMCSQLKKRKTHGTPRNGVQHVDVNHARVVVFVTNGRHDAPPGHHLLDAPTLQRSPYQNVFQFGLLKNPFLNCDPKFSTSKN